jgi:hypothetical protein
MWLSQTTTSRKVLSAFGPDIKVFENDSKPHQTAPKPVQEWVCLGFLANRRLAGAGGISSS